MLGRGYPGYFSLFDENELSGLIRKSMNDKEFYRSLKSALADRRRRFAPAAERGALAGVVREALGRRA
jgi:hypothetical protein